MRENDGWYADFDNRRNIALQHTFWDEATTA